MLKKTPLYYLLIKVKTFKFMVIHTVTFYEIVLNEFSSAKNL